MAPNPFDTAEVAELRVGSRMHDFNANAPVVLGEALGMYAAHGLVATNLLVPDALESLLSGEVDIAGVVTGTLVDGVKKGLDVVAISAKRCAMTYNIAVQPDAKSLDDLAGRDVVIGFRDDPTTQGRLDLLAAAGWDLRRADVNFVHPPGGADAWTKLFYAGELAVTNFYPRHRQDMNECGANIVVAETIEWPNDFYVVHRAFLEENPNAIGRFILGTLEALDWYLDPAHREEALSRAAAAGFSVELEIRFLEAQQGTWRPNLYLQEQPLLNVMAFQGIEDPPPFDVIVHLALLLEAQAALGLDNDAAPGARHHV